MKSILQIASLVVVLALAACDFASDEPSSSEGGTVDSISTVSSSAMPMSTTRAAARTTEQADSMAEQYEKMTSTSCSQDVDPVHCMYERRAYVEFFERSAMQTVDASYHDSLNQMFEMLYGQHNDFVSKGCPADPSAEDCSIPLMISDTSMSMLGAMFSVQ